MVTNLVPLHPSSTLVNVTERAEVHLVHLLAQRAPSGLLSGSFTSDCETCIGNGDTPGLLRIIFRDEGALTSLFSIDPPEESVSAFTLLSSLVDRVPNEDEQAALITEIFNVLVSNTTFDAQRRIAMLAALFNLRPSGSEKCTFLSKIVDMCASQAPSMLIEGQPLASMIEPNRLVELLSFWEVTPEQRRDIYGSVANAIESVEGSSKRGQTALLLYLRSFTDETSGNEDALAAAKRAAVGAIRNPLSLFADQTSLLSIPAVAALGDSATTKPLFLLLQIFAEGMLEDYQSFFQKNGRLIDDLGLSPSHCIRHMRLLSLCSLAAERQEIPYAVIGTTLQVDPSDVEGWVVSAVSSGLIEAKMDQVKKVVIVERCVVRKVDMKQWKGLQTKLNSWKKNIQVVLDGLKESHALHGNHLLNM